MSNPIALPEIFQAAFEDFIIPSYETAPFSTIQNRAKVTRSLKAIAGVERVMCKGINLLQNEFGPNGEQVFESSDKDSRVRFVGDWRNFSDLNGVFAGSVAAGSAEITFYGTGLNILQIMDVASSSRNITASVDGGSFGSNLMPASLSGVNNARSCSSNQVVPVSSGLVVGWHTVRFNITSNGGYIFGFEILNERANLAVYSGAGVSNGSSQGLSALATSAFNAGVSGTRGARVVKYVQGGVVSQAVQEVDATSKYLTLTDHTNEEVLRRINFREFGANRADDFSTLAGVTSDRAFTLDDGTTTLVGNDVAINTEALVINSNSSGFLTITFVGTGLDVVWGLASAGGTNTNANAWQISIDGGTALNWTTIGATSPTKAGVCSGLPYGTHTVKFIRNVPDVWSLTIYDFITYRPKTPSIPVGALKVAAYNVMADFVTNASVGSDFIGTGVLRKANIREMIYVGTWTAAISAPEIGGWNVSSTTVGNYIQYSFFGTGFDFRFSSGVGTSNHQITIDGSTNLSTFSTSFYGAGVTAFTTSTGTYTTTTGIGNGVRVSGLALGLHTVKITRTSGVTSVSPQALDIITPIHSQEPTFKVGSNSLKSVTKYSPEKSVANAGPDLSKAKAWVCYDGVNQKILRSYNVSAVLRASAGEYTIYLEKPFKDDKYVPSLTASTRGSSTRVLGTFLDYAIKPSYFKMSYASTTNGAIVSVTADDTTFMAVFFGEQIDE